MVTCSHSCLRRNRYHSTVLLLFFARLTCFSWTSTNKNKIIFSISKGLVHPPDWLHPPDQMWSNLDLNAKLLKNISSKNATDCKRLRNLFSAQISDPRLRYGKHLKHFLQSQILVLSWQALSNLLFAGFTTTNDDIFITSEISFFFTFTLINMCQFLHDQSPHRFFPTRLHHDGRRTLPIHTVCKHVIPVNSSVSLSSFCSLATLTLTKP